MARIVKVGKTRKPKAGETSLADLSKPSTALRGLASDINKKFPGKKRITGGAIILPESTPKEPGMRTTTRPYVLTCTKRHTIAPHQEIMYDGFTLFCPICGEKLSPM